MLLILIQLAILVSVWAVLVLGWRLVLAWRAHAYDHAQAKVVLAVRVSKENEKLPIVAEQIFAVLHSSLEEPGFIERLQGKTVDRFSFEIANVDEQISFYIHVPAYLRDLVEGQIYAQYPDVEISEVQDFASELPVSVLQPAQPQAASTESTETGLAEQAGALGPRGRDFADVDFFRHAYGAELGLTDLDIFPIKRHGQFEDKITRTAVDPLSGITAALAKLASPADRAMVQIVAQPLSDGWRQKAVRCARILGKNIFFGIPSLQGRYARAFMTRQTWPKIVFFPIYFIMWLQGLLSGTSVRLSAVAEQGSGDVLDQVSSASHDRESASDAMMGKVLKMVYDVNIRVVYVPATPNPEAARSKVRELAGSFKQFNQPHLNGFTVREMGGAQILQRYRQRVIAQPFVLNSEELATLFHLPTLEVKTPNIYWVSSRKLEPPIDIPNPRKEEGITTLGQTNYRGMEKLFGIRQEDRRRHMYVIGKTGMGKSTLLENMIISDIEAGKGVAVIDPHGDLADHVLDHIPSHRTNDVIVFDPSDRDHPVAFNMLENIDPAMSSVVASGLIGIFKKIYADSWGPRLEHILRNTILSLLEYPGTTMLGIPRILVDTEFRRRVVKKVEDPVVKRFWADEFEKMQERQRTEAISPIQNKVGQFLSSSIIRNIVGQPKSMVDLRFAMDTGKIFVCNLSKGKIGEDNSSLLGSMMITKFQLDAMSRSNIPEKDRVDFYLYVDEFQNFATDSFATILSEARKYRLNLTMANQYIAQMSDEVKDAVFGNVGTLMSFQVGYDDAEYISKQYSEVATPNDLVQLPKYNLYTKLLTDGMPSQPFSAATLPPLSDGIDDAERREKVIALSRERYAKPREMVEDKIKRWSSGGDRTDELPAKAPQKALKKPTEKQTPAPAQKIAAPAGATPTPPDDDDAVEIITPSPIAAPAEKAHAREPVAPTDSSRPIPGKPLKISGLTGFTPEKKTGAAARPTQQPVQTQQSAQPVPAQTQQSAQQAPVLTAAEQQTVEQYTIYYEQHYKLSATHARKSAIIAVLQQRKQSAPTAQPAPAQPQLAQQPVNPLFEPTKIIHLEDKQLSQPVQTATKQATKITAKPITQVPRDIPQMHKTKQRAAPATFPKTSATKPATRNTKTQPAASEKSHSQSPRKRPTHAKQPARTPRTPTAHQRPRPPRKPTKR